jgi:crotonobetainyl-CoA:carnitine CoA-transferase CaiB-like acyl-CoA transferase
VVEVAAGSSELGLGLAGGVPGMVLASLGATVFRALCGQPPGIDESVAWGQVWHRDKRVISANTDAGWAQLHALLADADVALVYGSEDQVEGRGLGYTDLSVANPKLVYARCRPSRSSLGPVADFGLLVEARAGLCTQLAGHRPGPILVDARAAGAGTTFLLLSAVLALLTRRTQTGAGGWTETSLYDGMLANLGAMIGRSERAAPDVERYWAKGSTFPNFMYRCADGELIQVWFGGKGMYAALLEVLGDEPSEDGYYPDQVSGALNERAVRWRTFFEAEPRDVWIKRLRNVGVPCEPVLAPGEALSDPHLSQIGLSVSHDHGGHHDRMVASPITVEALQVGDPAPVKLARDNRSPRDQVLQGWRVLDFSAFVAGPLAAQVLADLGAEVIKVEPPEGEVMRAAAYALAACQRGKRALALDLQAPEARPIVERLIRWADVVLHNFRVGVAERLGIDEETVARLNPHAVYCHASAFGSTGPRATYPGNDALMQAVTGLERAVGGTGNAPLAPSWIPIDMAGGWIAAAGILAGLLARATAGGAQLVSTSLLGAGMLLQSGVFERDGQYVRQPELDSGQTGYGPGYRLYECGDGDWLALVVPDEEAWRRLRSFPETTSLAAVYAPLRCGPHASEAEQAETVLEAAFRTAGAAAWAARLRAAGLLVELIPRSDRDAFRRGILDDPVNRQLGRVASFETADWGRFEQIGPLLRCGPSADGATRQMIPGVGEHTVDILTEMGFRSDEIDALLGAKVVRQL